ncbi:hypothetical protein K466DRAFT_592871 [Polyporus arcularius HHB13444]|uniref:Uncharacterized protein n=1 Tax=Polyporus arcularius HHB13444 TaxID=1314778 RepID=A0A5C3NKH6_9APHY|nr:hypothetical protein K466DRAFT_592871 [Polyporus arcularius HHB13444]
MTSRIYHPPWTTSGRASVVFVQISRDAFSVQVKLTVLYRHMRIERLTVAVGRNLTGGDPYSSSTERGSEPLATFYPLRDRVEKTGSDVALQDVRVPFHGTSGPEVTLRIVLSEDYHLRTYLLHLEVLGFEAARRDHLRVLEGDTAISTEPRLML